MHVHLFFYAQALLIIRLLDFLPYCFIIYACSMIYLSCFCILSHKVLQRKIRMLLFTIFIDSVVIHLTSISSFSLLNTLCVRFRVISIFLSGTEQILLEQQAQVEFSGDCSSDVNTPSSAGRHALIPFVCFPASSNQARYTSAAIIEGRLHTSRAWHARIFLSKGLEGFVIFGKGCLCFFFHPAPEKQKENFLIEREPASSEEFHIFTQLCPNIV